jgi:NitT/TauT family transport system substrate-binding protein
MRWLGGVVLQIAVLLVACGPMAPAREAAPAPAGQPSAQSVGAVGTAVVAPAREHLRIAYVSVSGSYLPLYVAHDAGLFAQQGLDVELAFMNGVQAVQALLAREVDLSLTDGAATVRAALGGGDTVILGASPNTFPMKLITNPAVQRPEDLRGRRIGVGAVGTSTDFIARYWLRSQGLVPGSDVSLISVGLSPQSFEAMVAGGTDAGVLTDPITTLALKQGFHELVDFGALGVEYPLISFATLRSTVREQPTALRAFVAGFVAATARLEKEREEALDILARYTRRDEREALNATYDFYVPRFFPRAPYVTPAGIATIIETIRDTEPRAAEANPADFYDNQFVRELDESGFIRRLYE